MRMPQERDTEVNKLKLIRRTSINNNLEKIEGSRYNLLFQIKKRSSVTSNHLRNSANLSVPLI